MGTITVLLSTYNGERCLPDLLDSLLAQTRLPDRVLVRDDGSTDGTLEVLASYQIRFPGLTFYSGPNLGARESFFEILMRSADPKEPVTDTYALCDQDDRWLPERLARSVAAIENLITESGADEAIPILACGRPRLVGPDFEPIEETRRFILPNPAFGNALVENICIGCTATFNRALLEQIAVAGVPETAVMHDWWLYLFAAGCGKVIYDPDPTVLYRQHGGNAIGMSATTTGHQLGRARRYLAARGRSLLAAQTASFLRCFGDRLSGEDRLLAERFAYNQHTFKDRFTLARTRTLRRQRPGDDLLFRLMLLLGHYRSR